MDRPAICAFIGAKARETTGAGVPALNAERSQWQATTTRPFPSHQKLGRGTSAGGIKSRRTFRFPRTPSVVESGHEMRQPRAGRSFFPPPGSAKLAGPDASPLLVPLAVSPRQAQGPAIANRANRENTHV